MSPDILSTVFPVPHNIRDDSQVMSVVDTYEPQGFVSVKDTKGEVSKPGLGIKVIGLSQDPLGPIEQRQKLRWRDVLPRQHGIRRPPAASLNPAAQEDKCPQKGESRPGCGRRGSDERLTDFHHRQAAVMNVHADRPFGYGRSAQSRTRHGSPKITKAVVTAHRILMIKASPSARAVGPDRHAR